MLQAAINSARASYPSLADKRVLITGGATGIGEGLVDQSLATMWYGWDWTSVEDEELVLLLPCLGLRRRYDPAGVLSLT